METESTARTPTKKRTSWKNDAAAEHGKSSMEVLIDWLTTHRNYDRWKGGPSQHGQSKESLLSEINEKLRAERIYHRDNRDIRSKISILEKSYRDAVDWRAHTGQGILARDQSSGTERIPTNLK